tara:strand:+ start:440 stop:646 length:207 start_codon:yes stop_codon:yes gene_type:complete
MEGLMFAKDQILDESEKNLIRKCLFVYQAKMYKDYSGVPQEDLNLISQIIDKLHLKQEILDDHPTYHI